MTAVAVSRLSVRSLADRAARAQARVEDALRVAPAGPERLLVVRRLELGRIAADARPERWHARAAGALADQGARAIHGAQAGAAAAGAVWFRSADEARALLLRELAAGRQPSAWFWRLAVRDWREAPLSAWLQLWIDAAERDPETAVALARAVVAAAEAGLLAQIVAAITAHVAARGPMSSDGPHSAKIQPTAALGPKVADAASSADPSPAPRLARRALEALPAATRAAFRAAFIAQRTSPAVIRWLARTVVLAAATDIAASPAVVDAAADALVAEGLGPAPATPPARSARTKPIDDEIADLRAPAPASELAAPVIDRQLAPPDAAPEPLHDPAAPSPATPESHAPETNEATSAYAGLLLLVRPLWRLGLAGWLDARPAAQLDGFARQLLHAIGRRMGAAETDPVLEALTARPDGEWSGEITAWRVGLDRWLRRTARLKLADLVKRRGGLLLAGDTLDIRFPQEAADIRLRRHALDLDPLWTPWLGLSIRYHFRDQPLQ